MMGELIGFGAVALFYAAGVALFWKNPGPAVAITWPVSLVLLMIMASGDRE